MITSREFGRLLKTLRKERRITQEELSIHLGVGKTAICNYEAGLSMPSSEKLVVISNLFNVSTDFMLGRVNRQGEPIVSNDMLSAGINSGYSITPHVPVYESFTYPLVKTDATNFLPLPRNLNPNASYFYLTLDNDRLDNIGIHKGDIIMVCEQESIATDDIALAFDKKHGGDDFIVGKIGIDTKSISFLPVSHNPKNKTYTYSLDDDNLCIIGKIISAIISL